MMIVKVNDMNCMHCVARIQKQLLSVGVNAKIKLEDKSVEVSDSEDLTKVLAAIKDAGYHPEV